MLLRILSQFTFLLLLLQAFPCFAEDFFRNQVAPILQRRCLSCHNSDDRKGQFSLQTHMQYPSIRIPFAMEQAALIEKTSASAISEIRIRTLIASFFIWNPFIFEGILKLRKNNDLSLFFEQTKT